MAKIRLTEEQEEIVQTLIKQSELRREGNAVISGFAGTGKTTMICELVFRLLLRGKKVAVTAMTGKATSVIRGKIMRKIDQEQFECPESCLAIETMAKFTKNSYVTKVGRDGEISYFNTWKRPEEFDYDVLIIDELSMIPQYLSTWWLSGDFATFGFGDALQIPEVIAADTILEIDSIKKEFGLAKTKFKSKYGVTLLKKKPQHVLSRVLRSTDEITTLCNKLRETEIANLTNVLQEASKNSRKVHYAVGEKNIPLGNDWQFLAYTNKLCRDIAVKFNLPEEYPMMQNKVLVKDNIAPIQVYNGEVLPFYELLEKVYEKENSFYYIILTWKGRLPRPDSPSEIERDFARTYEVFRAVREEQLELRKNCFEETMRDIIGRKAEQVNELFRQKIEMQFDIEDVFKEVFEYLYKNFDETTCDKIKKALPPLPVAYFADLEHGKCITFHKSQGSEYEKVCVLLEKADMPLIYTGISRTKEEVMIVDLR